MQWARDMCDYTLEGLRTRVNAHISVRESKISVGDPALGEAMRDIVGPEMVFCSEHTLFMYSKKAFSQNDNDNVSEEESSEESESEDDVSDLDGLLRGPQHDPKRPEPTAKTKPFEERAKVSLTQENL